MFGSIFDFQDASWAGTIGIFSVAFVVRLMDDYFDRHYDIDSGKVSLAVSLQDGVLPYSLLTMGLAVYLAPAAALTFFGAAYCLGMAGELGHRYPSGLAGYLEATIVVMGLLLAFDWQRVVFAFVVIAAVQAWDDLLDYREDQKRGGRNWAVHWGKTPILVFALGASVVALLLKLDWAVLAFASVPGANLVSGWLAGVGGKELDNPL